MWKGDYMEFPERKRHPLSPIIVYWFDLRFRVELVEGQDAHIRVAEARFKVGL